MHNSILYYVMLYCIVSYHILYCIIYHHMLYYIILLLLLQEHLALEVVNSEMNVPC
jgi:hypothetical protein